MKTFTLWNVLTLMVLVDRVKRARGFAGGVYNAEPEKKAKQFAEHWGATGCTSLRDMVDPICPGYGFSLCTADPVDVSGYKEMLWQNDEYNEGFLASHHGIVKVELVTRGSFMCQEFPRTLPKFLWTFSSCKQGHLCSFAFYWLAVYSPQWQIYMTFKNIFVG
ncbi:unnamed protein product [Peronospora belbahrii]|uniref:Uncharacterized protein n=1 Tax=Peronospora belbahrii TaxID=622444 RepID=A0AAU9L805_9STRA|nr:unnamed protein product [Peronospora belbahrii]